MAAYRVEVTRSAEREFRSLPRNVIQRFAQAIGQLESGPLRARPGLDIKRLRGTEATWRLRVGQYRGVFEVEGDVLVFTRFAHRSRVYDV